MNATERARRRLLYFAIAIAVLFGVLALATWWTGRENLREGSKVLSRGGPALRITKIPVTYHAVYQVDNRAGQDHVVNTERVWVRRPFQSRIESHRGPPPGTERTTLRQSAFGVLASISANATPLNVAAPPSLASGDLRVDAVLADALSDHRIVLRERREVYGRECQIYRAGGPVFAGDLPRYIPGRSEFADFCVDRNGIVVEEAWTYKNRLIQRRAAVEVEIGLAIDRELFDIDVPQSSEISRGVVQRIEPGGKRPKGLWGLAEAPEGFDELGTYAVVFPAAAVPNTGQALPGPGPSSTTDVYVRGPDLLVVDQDPSLARVVEADSRPARGVKIPGLRHATLIVDARMSEVRGATPDGSIVRIFGSLSPSELLDLARQLRSAE